MSETEAPLDPPETLTCPSCGAEVEFRRDRASAKCRYCGQSVKVPPELRQSSVTHLGQTPVSTRTSRIGCLVVVGFIVFMVLVTVVAPLVMTAQVMNSVPQMLDMPAAVKEIATAAAEVKAEPTRRAPTDVGAPTPAPTPTPGFADVALQFGEEGMGPGQFTNAHLSSLDGDGRLYVGEYIGGRIQVFDAQGKFLKQFFVGNKKTDLLGFAVDRKGVLYVADGGDITRWDGKTGKALGKIEYSGGPGFGELALAPDGSLYAMWYERRSGMFTSVEGAREDLVHFDADGNVINMIKGVISSMTDSVELENNLALDGRGNIYVAAGFEQTIFKFDPKGKFITRLGSSGEGDSQFHNVGAIAVDGQGRIYVVEDNDITVLKPDGSRVGKISIDGAARQLFFDDAGALWVTTDDGVAKYEVTQR